MNTGQKNEYYDVVVIGGGAAGMMAAIFAGKNGAKAAIIEKNGALGKKLLMTGNGRCNITQTDSNTREFIEKLDRNGKFLFSSLSAFGPQETIEFFKNSGLKLKTEKDGRVFPASDKAQDVLDILEKTMKKNGVKVMFSHNVLDLKMKDKKIEYANVETPCLSAGRHCNASMHEVKIYAKQFIITTGGKSYPATGSTGDGYLWLARVGHAINSLIPALVPVKIAELWIRDLRGISLNNAGIKLVQNGEKTELESGEIIFTHFGLSGPAIINASGLIGKYLKKGKVSLELDLMPDSNLTELGKKLKKDFESYKKKNLKTCLSKIFPQKLAAKIIELASIEVSKKIYSLTKSERNSLARVIKNIPMTVEDLLDFNHAMVTAGGVILKEIDPKTMRSKVITNLFIAGEILDLDGPTGGYNLQIAWTTGHAAGTYASAA